MGVAQLHAIDRRAGVETARAIKNLQEEIRLLRDKVDSSVSLFSGIPHLGEYTTEPKVPSYPATYMLSNTSSDADYGDEYKISTRNSSGTWIWTRFVRAV
jgi:hypothetical protein